MLDIRRAMALSIDRKAFVDIMFEGQADIGGTMLPAPDGRVGHAEGDAGTMPGYGPDIAANRAEARKLMEKARLRAGQAAGVKVSTRNIADLSRSRR